MITRYKIMQGVTEIMDLGERTAFTLDDTDYPADWFERNGTIPGHTIEPYDATPPAPPTPPVSVTGAQMIYHVDSLGELDTLLAVLTPSENAKLLVRRSIIAGDDVAEALRARLSVSSSAMETFILNASIRSER